MEHDGTPQREFNIFISYHHEDNHYKALTSIAKEAVKACNDDMGDVHFNCFLDENINPGTSWRTRINEALSRTDVLLPFITEDYCRSEECRYEFNLFFSKKHGNEFCLPVFWHAESVIAESLASDVQDAKDVCQKAQSINGISGIAPWRSFPVSLGMKRSREACSTSSSAASLVNCIAWRRYSTKCPAPKPRT